MMMSEKRFIVESVSIIDDCNEDKSRIAKVITDTDENYSYEDLYEVAELLNEQQATISALKEENEQLRTDFDFTIKQGELITKFSLGEDKILFETTQDYETIQTLSKWLYSMYDEIQKLKTELKWKREEIKALIEESERDE